MDLRELARRTVARDEIDFRTVLDIESLGSLDARLMDISPYGFQSRACSRILARGERVVLTLPLAGTLGADVMWGLKGLFGCKFHEPIDSALYADLLAALRAPAAVPDAPGG